MPMRPSLTAVIEQANAYPGDFATEPYEAAWATEARWFVHVLEHTPGTTIETIPQISPDGLTWCDEGGPGLRIEGTGLQSFALRDFGGWLRLRVVSGGPAKYLIHLALKG
jgi:hypothetical protein